MTPPILGQYDRVVDVYGRGNRVYGDVYGWSEKNLPVYYAKARDVAGPTLDTITDNIKVRGVNYKDMIFHSNAVLGCTEFIYYSMTLVCLCTERGLSCYCSEYVYVLPVHKRTSVIQ